MSENKKPFIDRVLEALKQSDNTKIRRFIKREVKFLNDQIKIRKEEISDIREKISDLKEEYDEALVAIDLDAIKTMEGTREYCSNYTDEMFEFKLKFKVLSESIEDLEEEIKQYQSLIDDLA